MAGVWNGALARADLLEVTDGRERYALLVSPWTGAVAVAER